jgi:uncharacterized membrane protein YsdA (DUF1294 family)/cold shock CspA family protein
MRLKGKLLKWDNHKAFGFIAPNGGGDDIFIHKMAFSNCKRTPHVNDEITFSVVQDKLGRYCADQAIYSGEKLIKKQAKNMSKFSIMLSIIFLGLLPVAVIMGYIPKSLALSYFIISFITFIAYALDKSKARRNAWRTPESTLHLLALIGGWPGAAIAQKTLRHKSQKTAFRIVFWLTLVVNNSVLVWLLSSHGADFLAIL